jgi:N-acetyl-anhydromuramyl-L-alanine amidase AmpD
MIVTYSLIWLPSVLKAAGLPVIEEPGWQTRGHGDVGTIKGVICHHTAGALKGNAPSLGIVRDGRPDLSGPLAQLVLGRDGTFYVIAAGKCSHAGAGVWQGVHNGNSEMIGIEAENTGLSNDNPWPAVQMESYAKGVAAILKHINAKPIMCVGHLEWAIPAGRKPDPAFSVGTRAQRIVAMEAFRKKVAEAMGMEDHSIEAPSTGAESTQWLQLSLNALGFKPPLNADGYIGPKTMMAVKAYQKRKGLTVNGAADPQTLAAIHDDLGHHEGCACVAAKVA